MHTTTNCYKPRSSRNAKCRPFFVLANLVLRAGTALALGLQSAAALTLSPEMPRPQAPVILPVPTIPPPPGGVKGTPGWPRFIGLPTGPQTPWNLRIPDPPKVPKLNHRFK